MTFWLTAGIVALGIACGVLFQMNGREDQTNSAQSLTIFDQKQQLASQASAVATTDSLKDQLTSAESDESQQRSKIESLQDQSNSFSSQLASRDQTIRQDQTQIQQLNGQVQQLTVANNSTTAELNNLKSQYAIAEGRLQITGAPILTPVQSAASAYPTHNIVEAKSIEASTLASQQAAANRVVALSSSMRTQFEAMPDFVQAKSDLDTCQASYDSAKQTVMIALHSTPEFLAAADTKKSAEQAVNDARESGTDSGTLSDLAQKSLDAGTAVTNLETSALAADSNFQDAKAKLDVARSNMNQLDQQFQNMLSSSQAYQQAKVDYDTAAANHTAALANVQAIDQVEANRIAAEEAQQSQANFDAIHQSNLNLQPQQRESAGGGH